MGKAPQAILDLVEHFERNIASYRAGGYNEAQVRTEFIDPMFEALGWDMANRAGRAEAYKDVIHEDAIKVGGATKAPDYCFRIGGTRKFFLEAKRPSVDIVYDADSAYQLRRYAWSSKLPLSILTDFDEFAVYDCRVRPNRGDKASEARIYYMKFSDFADRWTEIADVFSKEAVLRGAFDTFAEEVRGKRGTSEVDAEFLKEIEQWREKLARNFSLRNESISVSELNTAVQSTIDRIIFLRMCEDRGIEAYGQLDALRNGPRTYRRLFEVFYRADERYNSGLFHFNLERGRQSQSDEFTPELKLDDEVLKEIIGGLYYPRSPYEFGVLPPEILGNVYEQFLGKVIRLTAGHNAKVEEKPEVRKAGGVYYTPQYIVDYIVQNTVGELCKGKTPKEVEKLRILDPACGSGSFLLGAYKALLEFHRDWYTKDGPTCQTKAIYQGRGGQWFLTTAEKKRILLNNIYGVDIDWQAVEVTKLSLLLKVLEDESSDTLPQTPRSRNQRALPDIDGNIKCGNSLIGSDIYDGKDPQAFSEAERWRINAFDWRQEFPAIFSAGGFDAVIGNPPYLFLTEVPEAMRRYYQDNYKALSYRFDLYGAFVERAALTLLRKNGHFGFIIPHTLLGNDSFRILRSLLATKVRLSSILDLGPGVFQKAKNETMLLFFLNQKPAEGTTIKVVKTQPKTFPRPKIAFRALQSSWAKADGSPWLVSVDLPRQKFLRRLEMAKLRIGDVCTVNQGLRTGDNEKFLSATKRGAIWKPAAGGDSIGRFDPIEKCLFVYYRPSVLDAPRRPEIFSAPEKIIVQEIRNISLPLRIVATLDCDQVIGLQSTNVINLKPGSNVNIRYVLGVLNSAAVNEYFRISFPGNNHIASNQLCRLPLPEPADAQHGRMVSVVERMLELHRKLARVQALGEKARLEREIKQTDAQIDRLVYELYGLTEKEIGIVEEAGA